MSEKIDWIEKQASENLKFRLENCETLAKEANNLLTLLIAAIGAVVAYAIKNAETGGEPALLAGAIAMVIWLILVAFVLVFKCIMSSPITPIGNEPRNLNLEKYTLEELKGFELKNVQNSIDHMVYRNSNTAYWLDKVRLAAITSPLSFISVWAFWTYPQTCPCVPVV